MRRGSTTIGCWRIGAVVAAAFVVGLGRSAEAQSSSLQVSGSPMVMRIQGSTAGANPAPVVESSTTYTYASQSNSKKKITAQLSAPMPTGVTLTATFDAPIGGVSIPNVALDGTARDVVTGLGASSGGLKAITYTLIATLAAGVVQPQSRTVTLTVVAAP